MLLIPPATMKGQFVSICIFFSLLQTVHSNTQITECVKTSPCACISNLGVINLRSSPKMRFESTVGSTREQIVWSPCEPFTEGECSDVAVCLKSSATPTSYTGIGSHDNAHFHVSNGQLQITYTQNEDSSKVRTTTVTILCDKRSPFGKLTAQGETTPGSGHYLMTLRSRAACPVTEVVAASAATIAAISTAPTRPVSIVPIPTGPVSIVPISTGPPGFISINTMPHPTVTPVPINTPTRGVQTLAPPHITLDLTDVQLLLTGQIVLLSFIMVMLLGLLFTYTYKVCCKGAAGSRRAYDNL